MASVQGMYSVPGRALGLSGKGTVMHKALEGRGRTYSSRAVGCSHSSDEAGESRWSEGEHILYDSFDVTLGTLEARNKWKM
jgi:hypothetical protein